jgi:tetratricopeptide (TPR) repeat protein
MSNNIQNLNEEEQIYKAYFSLKDNQKYNEAFDILHPLYKKYPEDFKIPFLLGSVLYLDENNASSINYFKHAISINPKHKLSSLSLIHALGKLNKWNSAFAELRRFLLENTSNSQEHLNLLRELVDGIDNFSTSEKAFILKLNAKFKPDINKL